MVIKRSLKVGVNCAVDDAVNDKVGLEADKKVNKKEQVLDRSETELCKDGMIDNEKLEPGFDEN